MSSVNTKKRDVPDCAKCFYESFFDCPLTENDRIFLRDYAQVLIEKSSFTYVAESEGQVVGFIIGHYKKGFDKLLETRPNATLVYSMWSGYREKDDIKRLLEIFERRKCPIITLHTSGHADSDAIQKLIDTVKPKETIYVHKEA